MLSAEKLKSGLAQCYCSDGYRHNPFMQGIAYTDGIKYLVDNAEAGWLQDIIWSYQRKMSQSKLDKNMQFWTLTKNEDDSFTVIGKQTDMSTGESHKVVSQEIPYSDFPLDKIKIVLSRGPWRQEGETKQGMIMMLPTEM